MSISKHIVEHAILGVNASGIVSGEETGAGETNAWTGEIELGENQTYYIAINLPFSGSISSVTTRCDSGTATATVEINGTPLGGTANSVSSSEETQAHSSSNTFSSGQDITLVLSSSSNPEKIRFSIVYTRS